MQYNEDKNEWSEGSADDIASACRAEAQSHQTVHADDRRRKALFDLAADAIEKAREQGEDEQHPQSYAMGHRDGFRTGQHPLNNLNALRFQRGKPCALSECEPGLFLFGGALGFKSEYGGDAYCVGSGEYFWGGTKTKEARAALMVTPIVLSA